MAVALEPEVERLITKQVESGRFQSPSEVVAAGLLLLTQDESWDDEVLESKLLEGLNSGDAREMSDADWDRIGQ